MRVPVFLLFFFGLSEAVDFNCPANNITSVRQNGNIPEGATSSVVIPKGTDCTINFDIPNGYALFLQLSVGPLQADDHILLIDNNNQQREVRPTTNDTTIPVWLAATIATIKIKGTTGNSKFMVTYRFNQLIGFTQVKKTTGDYFDLSQLTGNTYFTFNSSPNDKVRVAHGKKTSDAEDNALDQIFVYDGDNLTTAKMIGTLADIGSPKSDIKSSSTSLTLVNFYGTKSTSYVIGNDATTMIGYSKYSFIVSNSGRKTYGNMGDLSGNVGGYTFLCLDCNQFYFTELQFATFSNGWVNFQGQSPTHKKETLIQYDAQTYTSSQMPQVIPTNMFTINIHLATIKFDVNTGNDEATWQRPYDGRKGYIISPSLWNPNANPNNLNYDFRNDTQLFTYKVDFERMKFSSNDQMTLQIGSGTGNPAINNQYPRDKSSTGSVSSNGNYMKVGLTASSNTEVRVAFEFKKYNSATSIGIFITLFVTLLRVF